jgi:hypothetical protein
VGSEFDEEWISAMGAVADGNVVLLLSPARGDGEHDACLRLSTTEPPPETAMIWVTFIEGADDRLDGWLDGVGELPASSSVVAVGQADHEVTVADPDAVRVERVRDARDLPRIGITISTILQEIDDSLQPVLCFNSVTTLLQYAESDRVFRFLTVLKNRLETSGAAGHYHLHPGTVDEDTVTALRELCDAVVEVTSDGEASIVG